MFNSDQKRAFVAVLLSGVGETSVNFTKGFWTCDKFYDKQTGRRLESNLAMHTFLGKNW